MQVESKLEETQPNINDVINILHEMRKENKEHIRKLETDLGNSVENCHQVIEELKSTVQSQVEILKKYEVKFDNLCEENKRLNARIKELERREDEAEQYSRLNCVEINGIPESNNENVVQLVKSVGNSLGIPISDEMVDVCHRLGNRRIGENRPRAIIVKFTRRIVKEELLVKRRVKRNLNTADIGFTDRLADVIYINESLTKCRRELHKEVRLLKKKKGFSYVWVRNGRILVRPTEGAKVIAVTTMDDLERLRGLSGAPDGNITTEETAKDKTQ